MTVTPLIVAGVVVVDSLVMLWLVRRWRRGPSASAGQTGVRTSVDHDPDNRYPL